jgi:hypothetical protein
MIKKILRTIMTNWIHLVGFYLMTYLTIVVGSIFDPTEGWDPIILTGFVAALLLFVVYGYVIVGWFYLAIILLDVACLIWTTKWRKEILILEWIIISIPFVYWAFEYEYWLWITLSVSLLTTQMIRLRMIKKVVELNGQLNVTIVK